MGQRRVDGTSGTNAGALGRRAVLAIVAAGCLAACSDEGTDDDTERLQARIDDCARSGGGDVRLNGGSFRVRELRIPSGVSLVGASGTRLVGLADQAILSVSRGAHDVVISGLSLVVPGAADHGIVVSDASRRVTVRNVSIEGGGSGIGVDVRKGSSSIQVVECVIKGVGTGVRVLDGAVSVQVRNLDVQDWLQRGIAFRSTSGSGASTKIHVSGNVIGAPRPGSGVRQPIQFSASSGGYFRSVTVVSNRIDGPSEDDKGSKQAGTADQISLHGCRDFSVRRNSVLGGGEVGITVSRGSRDGRVVGNTCEGNDSAGIVIGSMTGERVHDVVVEGNVCRGNGRNHGGKLPRTARSGIAVRNAQGVKVRQNSLDAGDGRFQIYGVSVAASAQVVIGENRFAGAKDANVLRFQKPSKSENL